MGVRSNYKVSKVPHGGIEFLAKMAILINQFCREKIQRIYRFGLVIEVTTILAVVCWILDKFFCDTMLGQKFPYLHAIWHVLIFISTYSAIVLVAYYAIKEDYANCTPELCYWPDNNFEIGIAFVSIKYGEAKRNL